MQHHPVASDDLQTDEEQDRAVERQASRLALAQRWDERAFDPADQRHQEDQQRDGDQPVHRRGEQVRDRVPHHQARHQQDRHRQRDDRDVPQVDRHGQRVDHPEHLLESGDAAQSLAEIPLGQREQGELGECEQGHRGGGRQQVGGVLVAHSDGGAWVRGQVQQGDDPHGGGDESDHTAAYGPAVQPAARVADAQLVREQPDELLVEVPDLRVPGEHAGGVHQQAQGQQDDRDPQAPAVVGPDHQRGDQHDDQVRGDEPQHLGGHPAQVQRRGQVPGPAQDGRGDRHEADVDRQRPDQPMGPLGEVAAVRTALPDDPVDDLGVGEASGDEEQRHHLEEPAAHPPGRPDRAHRQGEVGRPIGRHRQDELEVRQVEPDDDQDGQRPRQIHWDVTRPPVGHLSPVRSDVETHRPQLVAAVVGDLRGRPRRHPHPVDVQAVDQPLQGSVRLVLDHIGQGARGTGQCHVDDDAGVLLHVHPVDQAQVDDVDAEFGVDDVLQRLEHLVL
ncbi:hypothetical protein SDC9_100311 [bioreactor metagenome]|uniref:Uncharacterized protein n=1 Tax=bioreactor metagenome TaxID=1076179 RepID=A0A645ARQ0_9ZZZZ